VIEIAAFLARSGTTLATQFTCHRHQIDQRSACTQLDQADLVNSSFDLTAECTAVKFEHAVEIGHAQYDVIDFAYPDGHAAACYLK
jgi:hypothetical protein